MERITVKFSSTLDGNTMSGTAHVYGQKTMRDGRYETFAKGAFTKALETSDVRAFWNHNPDFLLGRQSSGTLRLEDTPEGLNFSLDLPDTQIANDIKVLAKRGDLDGMSFGFIPGKSVRTFSEDGAPVRTHTEARELVDISPVSLPAFEGTNLQVRSTGVPQESPNSQAVRARNRTRRLHEQRSNS